MTLTALGAHYDHHHDAASSHEQVITLDLGGLSGDSSLECDGLSHCHTQLPVFALVSFTTPVASTNTSAHWVSQYLTTPLSPVSLPFRPPIAQA
jgi:hypothetical protein